MSTKRVPELRVLSLGLGTQSSALSLMSAAGDLPKLDHIVFADTQGEMPETYAYLDYLRPIVEAAGIQLHVVTAGSLEQSILGTVPTSANPTPPVHVNNDDGSKGRVGNYRCSYDFKRRLVTKKVKELCGGRGAWKRATVEQWIGFSLDETHRMKPIDDCRCGHKRVVKRKNVYVRIHTAEGCTRCSCKTFDPWLVNHWPLVLDLKMRRHDTERWFGEHGHPTPPQSACWFCPNSSNARWQDLRAHHPDLFARAVEMDVTIRPGRIGRESKAKPFKGEMFLHGSLVPLAEADLRTKAQVLADAGQDALPFDAEFDCEAGTCGT